MSLLCKWGTPVQTLCLPARVPCSVGELKSQVELFINFLYENRIIKLKCVKQIQMKGFKSPPESPDLKPVVISRGTNKLSLAV